MSAETPHLGEFELIQRFFTRRHAPRAAQSGVILGIGDDAAVLALPPETELVAAVDTIVAGRHFPEGTDARSIGHRALAVNLSDIAAMGATPAWATLALTMPSVDTAWLERFSAGFLDLADANGVELVGGDTTRGPLTVSVQILGYVPRGTALRRSGARAGDLLAVTGTLGDAGAGLHFVTAPPPAETRPAALELTRRGTRRPGQGVEAGADDQLRPRAGAAPRQSPSVVLHGYGYGYGYGSPSCLKPLGYSSSSLCVIVRAISSASGGLR